MSNTGASAREIRDFAASKGIEVPAKGKLPWWVIRQWNKAFPDRPYETGLGHHPSGIANSSGWFPGTMDQVDARYEKRRGAGL